MRFVSFVAVAATTAALSSCQLSEDLSKDNASMPDAGACGASELSFMIGMVAADVDFGDRHAMRILGPDSAATMDHNPARLNVHTDKAGKITSLDCG